MSSAAVYSLMQLLEGIMDADSNWVLHSKPQIEFLHEKLSSLLSFLEEFSLPTNEAGRDLETKIIDTADNAECVIESHVCDQLLSESDEKTEEMRYQAFCQDLEKAIEETRSIQEEAMELRQQQENCLQVGLDDLINVKDWLTSSSSKLRVISIVGMGGMGKTTISRNLFDDPLIVYHFHIRSWVTLSQEYHEPRIFAAELLRHSTSELSPKGEEELAERLYKSLKGRRYLIVMDGLRETKVWDDVKRLFPDDNNGSRIILTTRIAGVGVHAASVNHVIDLSFLNSKDSWNLLCEKVFGEEYCPDNLVGIGQKITRYCQGLPLSLVVVGGLLSIDKTVGYWETIASSMNSLPATDGGNCSEILSLSYNHLPLHLKCCLLYFTIFPEDYDVQRSRLIRLWVAEGLVRPNNSESMEHTAHEYLEDLVSRNLIMVFEMGSRGKGKTYRIHNLCRDICITNAIEEFSLVADE